MIERTIRILIVVFFGAFIAKTPWDSLNCPILAYIGTGSLITTIILNIFEFRRSQEALDQYRDATHETFDKQDVSYIDEIPKVYKKLDILSDCVIIFLILSIVICPISYIVESTLGPKEVTQMAKKQQSTQQPSKNVGGREEKRSWDTPSRPITPTPVKPVGTVPSDTPAPAPTQPTSVPTQPAPAEPVSDPKPSTGK